MALVRKVKIIYVFLEPGGRCSLSSKSVAAHPSHAADVTVHVPVLHAVPELEITRAATAHAEAVLADQ